MEEVIPDFVARHIGRCIYCGVLPPQPNSLQDEHVIPYGLLPRNVPPWILYDASCPACANTTTAFERAILRRLWPVIRAQLNFRSYRKRTTQLFPLDVERDGRAATLMLPASEYPCTVNFLTFPLPGHLVGRAPERGIVVTGALAIAYSFGAEEIPSPEEIAKKLGVSSFKGEVTFAGAAFTRFLLKVAYGFTIGSRGPDWLKEIYVLDAILGRADDSGRWIGWDGRTALPPEGFHVASVGLYRGDALCRLRLFPPPAPEYMVVVGRVLDAPDS